MATAPTFRTTDDLAEGNTARSHNAVTTFPGDYVTVEVEIEAGNANTFQPSCTGLTFTKLADTGTGAGDSQCVIWSAPDAAGGSRTVTITPGGGSSLLYRSHLSVVAGSAGPGATAASAAGQTVALNRQGDNSAILMAVCDFNTGAVGTPTWSPGGSTLASQQGTGATYVYGRWDDSGPKANQTTGMGGTVFTGASIAIVEMLGTSAQPMGPIVAPTPLPDWLLLQLVAAAQTRYYTAAPATSPVQEAGTAALSLTGAGTAVRVAACNGRATLALGGRATAVRAATSTAGSVKAALTASGVARKGATTTAGSALVALSGSGTRSTSTAEAGTGRLALTGAGSAVRVASPSGRAAVALGGAGNATQRAVAAGRALLVLSGTGAARKTGSVSAGAAVALSGSGTVQPPGAHAVVGAGVLALSGRGVATRRATTTTGRVGLVLAGGGLARRLASAAGRVLLALRGAGSVGQPPPVAGTFRSSDAGPAMPSRDRPAPGGTASAAALLSGTDKGGGLSSSSSTGQLRSGG